MSNQTLASTSDGALLAVTTVVSVPTGIAIVAGGELVLGVGTVGGTTAVTTSGLTAAQAEIVATYQGIVAAQSNLVALETAQASVSATLTEGFGAAVLEGGESAAILARLNAIQEAIAATQAEIEASWTTIDLLLPGL